MAYDFDDPLDDVFGAYAPAAKAAKAAPRRAPVAGDDRQEGPAPREFIELCGKCNGSGRFVGWSGRSFGECFACKGVGRFVRKTSAEARAKARAKADARKVKVKTEALEGFAAAHPEIAAWVASQRERFAFAQAMHDAVLKYGELTAGQLAACERLVAKAATRKAERAAHAEAAPAVATDRLMAAFDKAKAANLKFPKMRFEGFVASLAPATGRNAGAVYLKSGETYLGKIAAGKFQASRECAPEQSAAIVTAMADPLAAAVAYGRRTGSCSCCGRELTEAESVRLGIGPICREKYGL